ncbi:MAG: DNA repair protein RecN [Pseudomonadota bacterium]
MLVSLDIRNIALIEELELDFLPGLNVLTGETGAGKSILLDALGFALGRKARRNLVRAGCDEGRVEAVFACPPQHPVHAAMEEAGLPGGEALVLRRIASGAGPSRAFVNDARVNAETLQRLGETLVEVHGQHDDQGLLNPKAHRPLLDAAADLGTDLNRIRSLWTQRESCRRDLENARETQARAAQDADYLRHAVEELERLAPENGEADALDAERRLIQSAAKIVEELGRAQQDLSAEGAEGAMATALSRLTHAAERVGEDAADRIEGPIAALDRAMQELADAQNGVAAALDALRFDPGRLEEVEERLFALRGLARKHQVQPDELIELSTELATRLDSIDARGDRISAMELDLAQAEAAYDKAAARLSAGRRAAAGRLDIAVTAELSPLKMENARFKTEMSEAPPGPEGCDRVSFTAAINPGAPAGPIDRIASGGELSRFLLALKVCLAGGTDRVMVFDEIDRGVGGATAAAVGRRLAKLAESAQVLVVTHSPQVAAEGAHHWRIAKSTAEGITRTDVAPLTPDQRIDEIARMLAGETLTEEARSAARSLMEMAG